MPTLNGIKKIAAILLMICFVLPLSRCHRNDKIELVADTNAAAVLPLDKRAAKPVYEDKYAYQNVANSDPLAGAMTIAAFFWPLLVFLPGLKNPSYRRAMVFNIIELVLCAGSAYMIYGLTFFGELRYGGYLAFLAIGAYCLSALSQIILRLWPPNATKP